MLDFEQFDALMFDCYGTLIDWETGILNALRPILSKQGVNVSDVDILEKYAVAETEAEKEYVSYREVLRRVMRRLSGDFNISLNDVDVNCLTKSIKDWPPFVDTVASLKALQRKYKLVILSNIDDDLFAQSNKLLEVSFDRIFTAQQIGSYKPNSNNFKYAIEKLDMPNSQILHVAQSVFHDIVPAKAMGLATVWVNRRKGRKGYGATMPATETPDFEVSSLEELVGSMGLGF